MGKRQHRFHKRDDSLAKPWKPPEFLICAVLDDPFPRVWKREEKEDFLEKPGKHLISRMMKANITT